MGKRWIDLYPLSEQEKSDENTHLFFYSKAINHVFIENKLYAQNYATNLC